MGEGEEGGREGKEGGEGVREVQGSRRREEMGEREGGRGGCERGTGK